MSLMVKNTTGAAVFIADVGFGVPASSTVTFDDPQHVVELATSANFRALLLAGTLVITDGTTDYAVSRAAPVTEDGLIKGGQGVLPSRRASRDALEGAVLAFASVSTVTIGASGVQSQLRDSTDVFTIDFSGALSVNIAASGAGGLDAGSEASDTWYAVFVIADTFGNNAPAGLFSTSPTAPTLPSGYDVFRRVGWVRNDGSSDFLNFFQSGKGNARSIFYNETVPNLLLLNNGSATSFTNLDLSSLVPPIGRAEVMLALSFDNSGGGTGNDVRVRPGDSTLSNVPWKLQPGLLTSVQMQAMVSVITDTSQVIQYRVSNASNEADIVVVGYRDDL